MKNWGYLVLGLIIGLFLAYVYDRNKKRLLSEMQMNDNCFLLSNDVDPSVFGPSYWNAFHTLADKVPCPSCQSFATKFISFFHDMVNLKTGKCLYDPANFNAMADLVTNVRMNNNKFPTS